MKKVKLPRFATNAEEAKWWDERMDAVEANLVEGIKTGVAQRGGPRRVLQERRQSKNITIRIALADIERARALAAERGIGYQTLMKMLLKQALDRESRSGLPRRRAKGRWASLKLPRIQQALETLGKRLVVSLEEEAGWVAENSGKGKAFTVVATLLEGTKWKPMYSPAHNDG